MKNWISLVPPCSILKCISPEGLKINVEREITGPVRVNGYNITEEEHTRALNGEKVGRIDLQNFYHWLKSVMILKI